MPEFTRAFDVCRKVVSIGTHSFLICYYEIDYRGFRLIAESFLPINKVSLAYGSHDGGITVADQIPELSHAMRLAAEKLNIKGHMCGRTATNKRFLYGPTDIEGHLGTVSSSSLVIDVRINR